MVASVADKCSSFANESVPSDFHAEQKSMLEKRVNYVGEAVSVKRTLKAPKVIALWPEPSEACVCSIADVVDEELRDDSVAPNKC